MHASSGFFNDESVWDASKGEFFSEKHRRIGEIINDYNPDLHLCYIPRRDRQPSDPAPFAITHTPEGKPPYVVMFLQENEVDETLLAKLYAQDSTKNDPAEYLDKLELAAHMLKMKVLDEKRAQARDQAEFMLRSPKHRINMGNGRVVHT